MPWILRLDPEGTYCCHLTPKELREATAEYVARENRRDFIGGVEGHYALDTASLIAPTYKPTTSQPCIYPSLTPESGEEEVLDCDDYWTLQAYRRYTSILAKVEKAKKTLTGEALHLRLETLREEWTEVYDETDRSWGEGWSDWGGWDSGVSHEVVARGESMVKRVAREEAEVAYCHRDPSDWQVRAEAISPNVEAALDAKREEMEAAFALMIREASEDLDQPFYVEEVQYLAEEMFAALSLDDLDLYDQQCREAKAAAAEMWKRLMASSDGDKWTVANSAKNRIITHWLVKNQKGEFVTVKSGGMAGRNRWGLKFIRPVASIGFDEFVAKKIAEAGDELAGLNKTLDSLRFRLVAKRERELRKAA